MKVAKLFRSMSKGILVFLFLFLSINLQSEPINECQIDFYFGNGVWNDLDGAKEGQKNLKDFLKEELGIDTKVKRAFNHTHGTRVDLIETFYQLAHNGQISFGYFHLLAKAMTPEIPDVLREYYLWGMMEEEADDLSTMVKSYQKAIDAGHRVLLVSHSQGNMFGLRAFDALKDWQKEYFQQVSVATPADRVANSGDWIT